MEFVKVTNGDYKNKDALSNVIHYITNPVKTRHYIGAMGVNPYDSEKMIEQMNLVKKVFQKECGHRNVRHFIVSFDKKDHIKPEEARWIADDVARFYSDRYQICYGVHLDTDDLHIHFALNTVSFIDGKLFSEGPRELEELKRHVHEAVLRYRPEKGEAELFAEIDI